MDGGKGFFLVDAANQQPGRVRNGLDTGQDLHATVIPAADHAFGAFDYLAGGKVGSVKRETQMQGGVRVETQRIQEQHLILVAPDHECFGRPARGRPCTEEGVQIV